MIRWAINLSVLAGVGWVARRILGFLAAGRNPISADALLAGGRFVNVAGVRLHYEKSGAGPPAVFIHGPVGSSGSWIALTASLSDIATTYALDLPGSGLADKPDDRTYHPAEHAATLIQFVETVIGRPVRLVSSSSGAQAALTAMTDRPDLFTGLVALAPVLEFPYPTLTAGNAGRLATLIAIAFRSLLLVRLALNLTTGPDARITDHQLATLMTPALTAGYRDALFNTLASSVSIRREDFSPPDDKLVLIIRGLADPLAPSADAEWLRLHSGGDLHLLPGCGHLPESERTEDVAALLRDFLTAGESGEVSG